MSFLKALEKADECFSLEAALCQSICEVINTPRSLAVSLLIQEHEWDQLKNLPLKQEAYSDGLMQRFSPYTEKYFGGSPTAFCHDRLVSRMLVKSDNLPTGLQTDEVAIMEFHRIEEINRNRAITPLPMNAPWLLSFANEVMSILSQDGPFLTSATLDEILDSCRFGPGSSAGLSSPVMSDKLRQKPSISSQLLPFLPSLQGKQWREFNHLDASLIDVVDTITVPKTAFTDRTVSAVPSVNMFLQLGIQDVLAQRLRRAGIDLKSQKRNQYLASRARELKLSTIDLRSASSWFTQNNLLGIVPDDLLHMLDLVRPHRVSYSIGDVAHERPMYNWLPMGCGYTFSLMSIYFWALVRCTVPKSCLDLCSVFGDDIIVPQKYYSEIVERLEYLGFEVNCEKSYHDGNFYESCGHEYFCGHYVTPFYCRSAKTGSGGASVVPIKYRVQLANRLRLWSAYGHFESGSDIRFKVIWDRLLKHVPKTHKPPIPYVLGDTGLIVSPSEHYYLPYKEFLNRQYDRYMYEVWCYDCAPVKVRKGDNFVVLLALLQMRTTSQDVPRNSTLASFALNYRAPEVSSLGSGEPVKGLFGLPKLIRTITEWPCGLSWVAKRHWLRR